MKRIERSFPCFRLRVVTVLTGGSVVDKSLLTVLIIASTNLKLPAYISGIGGPFPCLLHPILTSHAINVPFDAAAHVKPNHGN